MSRGIGFKPILQCGECSTLFIVAATQMFDGKVYELCPNPRCHGPISKCEPIVEAAVSWAFMHIIGNSGIPEVRRMHLRCIAESQMKPWHDSDRHR